MLEEKIDIRNSINPYEYKKYIQDLQKKTKDQ
jgi:hypothetical protein